MVEDYGQIQMYFSIVRFKNKCINVVGCNKLYAKL